MCELGSQRELAIARGHCRQEDSSGEGGQGTLTAPEGPVLLGEDRESGSRLSELEDQGAKGARWGDRSPACHEWGSFAHFSATHSFLLPTAGFQFPWERTASLQSASTCWVELTIPLA